MMLMGVEDCQQRWLCKGVVFSGKKKQICSVVALDEEERLRKKEKILFFLDS